jgi:hypothetical protein
MPRGTRHFLDGVLEMGGDQLIVGRDQVRPTYRPPFERIGCDSWTMQGP